LLAWLVYQPMHFAYWDEHNLRQAVLLAVLGVFSYLAAVIASVRLQHWQGNHAHAVVMAWLVLGIGCLPAVAYPMISILMMALILAVASVWHVRVKADTPIVKQDIPFNSAVLKYLFFLLALDFSLTLWDYQVDSRWAWHLALLFITAALGSRVAFKTRLKFYWLVVVVVVVNFIVAIVWPGYVISSLHSALIGLCMGWVTGCLLQGPARMNPYIILSISFPLVLGLVLGNLFYANLAYETWRALLLLPLTVLILRGRTGLVKSANDK